MHKKTIIRLDQCDGILSMELQCVQCIIPFTKPKNYMKTKLISRRVAINTEIASIYYT